MDLTSNITVFFLFLFSNIYTQPLPGRYRVQFKDKENNSYSLNQPEEFLSVRAIQRRERQNISIQQNDLPVSQIYIDSLEDAGIPVTNRSKWFNSITTGNITTEQVNAILQFSFVSNLQKIKPITGVKKTINQTAIQTLPLSSLFDYGFGNRQITIHNGDKLHEMGFTGEGIHIAILDAGFYNTDILPGFNRLWANNHVLGTRDFVDPDSDIFSAHSHGTTVFSVIGSYMAGELIGTAPDASFWLLRSEDTGSEYLIEEDNWVTAAEFADSVGIDIINTSLGYSEFDDPTQNHTNNDMDGNSTRISIAADIAASKGILVVVSAGNQGNTTWRYITAPADADSVLAIGAVDMNENIAYFSSRGPSSDGRIKPDVCAIGIGTYVQSITGMISMANGTSVSAPIITGLSACLWQANPSATNMDIYQSIIQSSDRFENPDTIYGHGIPDFLKANLFLRSSHRMDILEDNQMEVFPNPFHDVLFMDFWSTSVQDASCEVFSFSGSLLAKKNISANEGYNLIHVDWLSDLQKGTYIITIRFADKTFRDKIIKL